MNDNISFYEACQAILNSSKANGFAKAYAAVGIKLANGWVPEHLADRTKEELLRVQALYILNNIQHWRDPSVKSVRATLKIFAKE